MVVKTKSIRNESGQSVLEIVFVLPFLFLFVGLLYKLNMAVQMAINNTQYARSQVYVLTANSPEYPRLYFRHLTSKSFANMNQDQIVLGVTDPANVDFSNESGDDMPRDPQVQKIARAGATVSGSTDSGEVKNRTSIRVRNTASICTQLNGIGKSPMDSNFITSLKSKRWPFGTEVCQYKGKKEG